MLGDKNVQLWQFIALGSAPAQMWNIQRSGYGSVCEVEVSSSLVSELKHQDSRFKSFLKSKLGIKIQTLKSQISLETETRTLQVS